MITNKEVRISVNKTLTRKLIYVVAALTLLAMLIPAMAVPVSAAAPTLSMVLVDPITGVAQTTPDSGYNIRGSIVEVTAAPAGSVVTWSLNPPDPAVAQFFGTPTTTAARVQGWLGNVTIEATNSANETGVIPSKKFGLIDHTNITAPGTSYVTWNEEAKAWQAGPVKITDTVTGVFAGPTTNVMQGVILNWYLLPGNLYVNMAPEEFLDHTVNGNLVRGLKYRMEQYVANNPVNLVSFAPWSEAQVRMVTNISDALGQNFVNLYAKGEEAVQVVCVPEYPGDPQIYITPEKTSHNFYTTESEVVPQVRWAGEKIVLEKYFGPTYNGKYVQFALENQSVGALEPISANASVDHGTVWTPVTNGFASAILVSSDQGVASVVAGLYEAKNGTELGNQHFFTVYFLKFESLTIGDVQGKRMYHNDGIWNPEAPNPWSTATDQPTQTLNVSQDALVRARVKGWFTNSNPSVRLVRTVDPTNSTLENPGTATLTLPAGRWILPDDWATLAGPNWKQGRIHWDIMNSPDGSLTDTDWVGSPAAESAQGLGNYYLWSLGLRATVPYFGPPPDPKVLKDMVGNANVIGPFSPGIEIMTPKGWEIVNAPEYWDSYRQMHTVVPDGYLNSWDAPMPAAKVIYQIQDAGVATNPNEAGYFKWVNKTDIYYTWATNVNWTPYNDKPLDLYDQYIKIYTNPFYQAMIPAHEAIPAFINNGGYDWNSFDTVAYGPYVFWEFINQNRYLPIVSSIDPAGHPTCVEVYSDNHGEAMVWLNGNWNLDLSHYAYNKGSADVPYQAVVGTTAVQATVDYPYTRLHQAFQSNTDVKTWLWGGLILGTDQHQYGDLSYSNGLATRMVLSAGAYLESSKIGVYPFQSAASTDKVVWVWVTDRDGLYGGVFGAQVDWNVSSNNQAMISTRNTQESESNPDFGISQYNEITKRIYLRDGFLKGTGGSIVGDIGKRTSGVSYLRKPTVDEKKLFNKFWGNGYKDPVSGNITPPTSSLHGLNPDNFCVAAIDLLDLTGSVPNGTCNVTITVWSTDFDPYFVHESGQILKSSVVYNTNVRFGDADPLDDAIRAGDANCDGVVNMADVTAVERMILGYNTVTTNAVLNTDGTVDMGTVVTIERTILGLK